MITAKEASSLYEEKNKDFKNIFLKFLEATEEDFQNRTDSIIRDICNSQKDRNFNLTYYCNMYLKGCFNRHFDNKIHNYDVVLKDFIRFWSETFKKNGYQIHQNLKNYQIIIKF